MCETFEGNLESHFKIFVLFDIIKWTHADNVDHNGRIKPLRNAFYLLCFLNRKLLLRIFKKVSIIAIDCCISLLIVCTQVESQLINPTNAKPSLTNYCARLCVPFGLARANGFAILAIKTITYFVWKITFSFQSIWGWQYIFLHLFSSTESVHLSACFADVHKSI